MPGQIVAGDRVEHQGPQCGGLMRAAEAPRGVKPIALGKSSDLKARDEAQLAATALARTLKVVAPLRPSSPLFVASQPLPALLSTVLDRYREKPARERHARRPP